jgi:hypothetical protein
MVRARDDDFERDEYVRVEPVLKTRKPLLTVGLAVHHNGCPPCAVSASALSCIRQRLFSYIMKSTRASREGSGSCQKGRKTEESHRFNSLL